MAFDGVVLKKISKELEAAYLSHIDKLYQPSRDELVFLLRKKGFAKRLLISAKSGEARIQFTENKPENPETPPMFCMLARKYFSSAKFIGVRQIGLDRILELSFETSNEMGDRTNSKIVCEFLGGISNIILVGENGRIIDAVRRSDVETSKRLIQPGAKYVFPETSNKLNILTEPMENITACIMKKGDIPLSRAVLETADGISPLVAREVAFKTLSDDTAIPKEREEDLKRVLNNLKFDIENSNSFTVLMDSNNVAKDFSYTDIMQYGCFYTKKTFDTITEALDFYYKNNGRKEENSLKQELLQTVNALISRVKRRMGLRKHDLENSKSKEHFRIYGELLKANLYTVKSGDSEVTVQNFYDENLAEITIPLKVELSPQANAQRYFKEYKKAMTARQTLNTFIENDAKEIEYLESVADSLSRSETLSEASEIREELILSGYLKRNQKIRQSKKESFTFKEYVSPTGKRIIVGKNNRQNDYITTKLAEKNDLWFHTKGVAGSHVILKCSEDEADERDILFSATLAAKNSKAANSSNVAVDYTPVKYVKKPSGAKAGMVIYTTNKTVFVTPDREEA